MFGFRNFTGFSFVGKVWKIFVEFSAGIVEEITFNVTSAAAANAAEIPENINVKFISKDQFITNTAAVVGYKIARTSIFNIMVRGTPNLLI